MSGSNSGYLVNEDMRLCIWKSPNTQNVANDSNYENGKFADYEKQSSLAYSFYNHVLSLPRTVEIPESNLGVNTPKDGSNEPSINIIKDDNHNNLFINLSLTFCTSTLSAVNTSYLIPEEPGYLVMILYGNDSMGVPGIICALCFHFELLLDSFDDENSDYYPIIAHLDGFCKNCDNANIKGAGIGIDIFFDICKKWNDKFKNKIIKYQLEALPNAHLYWKNKFGFILKDKDAALNYVAKPNNDDVETLFTMTRPLYDMKDVNLENQRNKSSPKETSAPILTHDEMEAIDWAITWDEMTEGLEQEMLHQQQELRRGMSKSHRRAWGDDGYESDSPLRTTNKKAKKAKKAKGAKKTKGLKRTPRRRRNRTQRGYDSI